jgi:hypothetical protein
MGFIVRQVNKVNIFHTNTEPTITPIKNLFYNFQISQAQKDLTSLISVSDSTNISNMYSLHLVRAEFQLKLHKFEEFKSTINFIENEYRALSESDNKNFKTLKLTYLSLEQNEEEFFKLATNVSMVQGREIEYYHLIYYINTHNQERIVDILNRKKYIPIEVSSEFAMILGHAHKALIDNKYDLFTNYRMMIEFYDKYESEKSKTNKIDLLTIDLFKCSPIIDSFYKQKTISIEEIGIVKTLISDIERFQIELENFGNEYQRFVFNSLVVFYKIVNEKNKFEDLFTKKSNIMDELNFIDYYFTLNNKIDANTVYEIYKNNNFVNFVIAYLESLYISQKQMNIVEFIDTKELVSIENEQIKNFYFLSKVELKTDVENIFDKYENVENDLLGIIIYLKASKILNKPVKNSYLDFVEKLLSSSSILSEYFIKILIELLFKLDNKFTYSLILKIQDIYQYLTLYIIDIAARTDNIRLNDFEIFLSQIDLSNRINSYQMYVNIGNLYNSFFNSFKTYEYYLKAWEKQNDIELATRILELIIRMKNQNISFEDNDTFLKIYSYLNLNNVFNDIEAAFLGAYYHFQNSDYKEGVKLFNKKMLSLDTDLIAENPLDMIASLYMKSILDVKNESEFNSLEENLLIIQNPLRNMTYSIDTTIPISFCKPFNQIQWVHSVKNNKYYIHSIYHDIPILESFRKYNFQYKSTREMKLFTRFDIRQSLFHFFANGLIHKASSIQMVETNIGKENEFENLFEMIKSNAEHNDNMIKNYHSGLWSPFFYLAKSRYENYPPFMINELLYNPENTLNAGLNNPNKEAKKLISISSLFLLKYLGHLEKILALDNVYIQSTVLDWIERTKESMKYDKTKMSMSYKNGTFYKHEATDEEREGLVKVYEDLYDLLIKYSVAKEKVVNDYEFSIPYKLPLEALNLIGYLDAFAMAFALNNKYQIITEDISITQMYEMLRYNTDAISNMTSLLQEVLDTDVFIDLMYELHKLSYKETLNTNFVTFLNKFIENGVIEELSQKELKILQKVIIILNQSGYLENLKKRYRQVYMAQDYSENSALLEMLKFIFDLQYLEIEEMLI